MLICLCIDTFDLRNDLCLSFQRKLAPNNASTASAAAPCRAPFPTSVVPCVAAVRATREDSPTAMRDSFGTPNVEHSSEDYIGKLSPLLRCNIR